MILLRERILNLGHNAAIVEGAARERDNAKFRAETELNTLRREYGKLQQAIFEAAQIQRTLCAPRELAWGGFEIAGEIFPVRHLSGDFFKVMEFPSGLGVALGDIAGKGMTAGIWQTHVMGVVQRAARRHSDPAAAIAEVNGELCAGEGGPPLTALFFARIDSKNNELLYCNAGLPAPLLLRADGALEPLETGGPMLGAVKDGKFQTGRVTLSPGDMVVAYSDGVTECRNAQDQEFETARLAAAVKSVAGTTASKALFSLLGTVLDFAGSCSPGDDMTVLVLRRNDATKKARTRAKRVQVPDRRQPPALPPKIAGQDGPVSK